MTRKDFEKIASVLKQNRPNEDYLGEFLCWRQLVLAFAAALEDENPLYDRVRFINACESGLQN